MIDPQLLLNFDDYYEDTGPPIGLDEDDAVQPGNALAIGVSHFCQQHMLDILEVATIPIAANQVEYHVGMAGGANAQM